MLTGYRIPVHDHGYVEYLDHMGDDLTVVSHARVSYQGSSKGETLDRKLLRYLYGHRHTSPFEMVKVKFEIKMPIFVMRQYIRHRMQNVNEVSARYSELPSEFFVPEKWRAQDTKNKQGGVGEVDPSVAWASKVDLEEFYQQAYTLYQTLIGRGVAREQARIVLPVGIYTKFHCCWDLNNLLHYFTLRDDPHAQGEHQDYARAMQAIVRQLFPSIMEAYDNIKWKMVDLAALAEE